RKRDIDKIRSTIKDAHQSSFIYIVEDDGKLVGFLSAKRGHVNRIIISPFKLKIILKLLSF
ncbi:unnamed protein product, partial [marine sediment metagenome]